MPQVPDDAAAMLVRLCLFGPVMYVGLLMIIDPMKIVKLLSRIAAEIAYLDSSIRDPFRRPDTSPVATGMRNVARLSGVALTLFGVAHVIGIVS